MANVWIKYTDFTGNSSDYSVAGWTEAHGEAARLINNHKNWITEETMRVAITMLLQTTEWETGVKLYNKHNAGKEELLMRYGTRVDTPAYVEGEVRRHVSVYDQYGEWLSETPVDCQADQFRDLFDHDNDIDMRYVYPISTAAQRAFFEKLGVTFDKRHFYYIECN